MAILSMLSINSREMMLKSRKKWLFIFVLLICGMSIGYAAVRTLDSLKFDSRWPEASSGNIAVGKNNNTVFFSDGNILTVLDVDSLNEKSRLQLKTEKGIKAIKTSRSGNYVYAACGSGGLLVIDVSKQTSPVVKSEYMIDPEENEVHGTEIDFLDNRVYMADVFFGLRIIDVSNPLNPYQVGSYEQFSEYASNQEDQSTVYSGGYINIRVKMVGSRKYAFVLDKYYGIRILDVTIDSNPELIDQYDMRAKEYWGHLSEVVDIDVDNKYAYISDSAHGITILDFFSSTENSSLIKISKVGQIETPGSATGIFLEKDTLYVASGNSGLFVVDVADRTKPEKKVGYDVTGTYSVFFANGKLFLADCINGLSRLGLNELNEYSIIASYDTPADTDSMFADTNYAYLLDNGGSKEGLRIVFIQESGDYRLVGSLNTPGDALGISVLEDVAYIADGSSGLLIVDVKDKNNPVITDTLKPGGYAIDVKVIKRFNEPALCYILDKKYGLIIAEISEEGVITEKSVANVENAMGFATYGRMVLNEYDEYDVVPHILIVDGKGLYVINVSDQANPVTEGYFETECEALDVGVKDDLAVIAGGDCGIALIDISELENMVELISYDTEGKAERIYVHGPYVHVADGANGLQVIGIVDTEPVEFRLAAFYNTPGYASDVFVAETTRSTNTYISDKAGGFVSFAHVDKMAGGIDERPFTVSNDRTGFGKKPNPTCFISSLF